MNWQAKLRATVFTQSQLPEDEGIEVAIVGRSNVGKSSLINKLINQRLAHVSSKPGKTRSINLFDVKAETPFTLVDLPGFGYAARSKSEKATWDALLGHYVSTRRALKLVIHLVDMRHGLVGVDKVYQSWAKELQIPTYVVFTKADKVPVTRRKSMALTYMKAGLYTLDVPLATSINEPASIDALRMKLLALLNNLSTDGGDERV